MFISFLRAIVLYLILILSVRLMGKRQVGELEPSEFVIALLIANLASVPMQDTASPLLAGVIPILTVLSIELILSVLSMRCLRIRKLVCGNPILLIENGVLNQENMRRTRVTVDELVQHLRENSILDISTVKYAILETSGHISTILFPKHEPATAMDAGIKVDDAQLPVILVSDGRILSEHLAATGRDEAWLERQLKSYNCRPQDVFLFTATQGGKLYLAIKKEARP